jgi:hypothetical protein
MMTAKASLVRPTGMTSRHWAMQVADDATVVRRQSFWDSQRDHLREALARLVSDVKRLADDAASVGLRWSVV